jgi:hypothetical protein
MLDNITGIADAAEFRPGSEGGDGELLGLFRQWVTCVRHISDDDNIEWLDIEEKISATPAVGALGLALKVILLFHEQKDDLTPDSPALDSLVSESRFPSSMDLSVLKDLSAIVPELGPLVADAIEGATS